MVIKASFTTLPLTVKYRIYYLVYATQLHPRPDINALIRERSAFHGSAHIYRPGRTNILYPSTYRSSDLTNLRLSCWDINEEVSAFMSRLDKSGLLAKSAMVDVAVKDDNVILPGWTLFPKMLDLDLLTVNVTLWVSGPGQHLGDMQYLVCEILEVVSGVLWHGPTISLPILGPPMSGLIPIMSSVKEIILNLSVSPQYFPQRRTAFDRLHYRKRKSSSTVAEGTRNELLGRLFTHFSGEMNIDHTDAIQYCDWAQILCERVGKMTLIAPSVDGEETYNFGGILHKSGWQHCPGDPRFAKWGKAATKMRKQLGLDTSAPDQDEQQEHLAARVDSTDRAMKRPRFV